MSEQTTTFSVVATDLSETVHNHRRSYTRSSGRVLKTLAPDIALLSNFVIGDPPTFSNKETNTWVNTNFGADYYWCREQVEDDETPNAIVSRFPILLFGQIHNDQVEKDHIFAKVQVSGNTVWLFSASLCPLHFKRPAIMQQLMDEVYNLVDENDKVILGLSVSGADEKDEIFQIAEQLFDPVPHISPLREESKKKMTNWIFARNLTSVPVEFAKKHFDVCMPYETGAISKEVAHAAGLKYWRAEDSNDHASVSVLRKFAVTSASQS